MHPNSFDDLIPHMRRAGFIATALAAVITAMFGWQLGENVVASFVLAGLLALCTFIVGYSLVAAYHAWKRDMKGVSVAATALFAVAVCVEFLSHTGFTAANRDATIQQASFQTTTYEDGRAQIRTLEAEVARLEAKHDWQKSYEPAEAYDDKIALAEDKVAYEEARGGCKRRCMAAKAEAASLKAERAIAADRVVVAEEIKMAKAELAKAREAAGVKHAGHAAGASQGMILAAAVTATEKPSESAQFWTGVGISALLALFAICAGGLLNFIAFAFEPDTASVASAEAEVQKPLAALSAPAGGVTLNVAPKSEETLAEAIAKALASVGDSLNASRSAAA